MSVQVSVPGPELPGLPAFSLLAPPGWAVLPLDAVLAAVAEPPSRGVFRANLTVSWQRLALGPSLDALADQLLAQQEQAYPGLRLVSDAVGTLSGQQARAQEYAFDAPEIGSVFQIQAVLLVPPRGGVQDLLQLHATCGGDRAAELVVPMREAIVSFQLTGESAG